MAKLDNLTAKILADANAKAKELISAAEAEARSIIAAAEAEAQKEAALIAGRAETEAVRKQEQMVLSQTLAVRDENLGARGKALDSVFAQAKERLEAMPREEFVQFLSRRLMAADTDGQEIILPKKYAVTAEELEKAGGKAGLSLYAGERDIPGGFVLSRDGIDENNTFDALIDFYRYELEGEVLKALY